MHARILLLTVVSALLGLPFTRGAVHYVSPSGSHQAPFGSWSKAATNIQAAINVASPGSTVLVGDGTYVGAAPYFTTGNLTNMVAITKGVTVVSDNGPTTTILQPAATASIGTKARRGVYLANGASLIGFTISGGATRSRGDEYLERSGGGIYANGAVTISNCVVAFCEADRYGGGIYAAGTGTELHECSIRDNAAWRGGGVAGYASLFGGQVLRNEADLGGGLHEVWWVSDCDVIGNNATTHGGGIVGSPVVGGSVIDNEAGQQGGGLHGCEAEGTLLFINTAGDGGGAYGSVLTGCTNLLNLATNNGGGAYACEVENSELSMNIATNDGGGAFACSLTSSEIVSNRAEVGGGSAYGTNTSCLILGNQAMEGGGLFGGITRFCEITGNTASNYGGGASGALLTRIEDSTITGNRAGPHALNLSSRGGGAFGINAPGGIWRCRIENNVVTNLYYGATGGGVHGCYVDTSVLVSNVAVGNASTAGEGGGAADATLIHCTVAYNTASFRGGGLYEGSADAYATNTIVYHNQTTSGTSSNHFGNCTFTFCCTAPNPGGINVDGNPNLVAFARLGVGSSCIDNSLFNLATQDLAGIARPLDGDNDGNPFPDIGAYEFVHASADTDGDTMHDNWEIAHSLDPVNDDTLLDGDHDRMTNLDEYNADTHPGVASSFLGITNMLPGAGFTLYGRGGTDATQYLERCDNLDASPQIWQTLSTNLPPTPDAWTAVDSLPPIDGGYRIRAARR